MSILLKDISDTDTILMFTEDSSFPSADGVIQIEDEVIAYTTNYMGTLYGCIRGFNSTSAAFHTAGVSIILTDFFGATSIASFALLAIGEQGAPSYAFSGDPTKGFEYDAGNQTILSTASITIPENLSINFGADNGTDNSMGYSSGLFSIQSNGGEAFLSMDNTNAELTLGINLPTYTGAKFDTDGNAGDTRLLLWDITAGIFQRVSIGDPDSGGTGFRVLRIPN